MKFGLVLPTYGPDSNRSTNIHTARAAEDLGFDSIWVTDHLALPEEDSDRFGRIFESISLISYLAGVTTQIKLGISALVLPQRNPVEVAKMLATVDLLSGGRFILSAGVGWSSGEYFNLGQNFSNRGKRMDEAIQVLRLLWSGREVVSFKGNFYHFENLVLSPQPLQKGGPPIWIAGNSIPAIHRAAMLGDGWHPTLKPLPKFVMDMKELHDLVNNRPFTVCMRINMPMPDGFLDNHDNKSSTDSMINLLMTYQDAGLDMVVFDFYARNQAERENQMKTLMTTIAPALK